MLLLLFALLLLLVPTTTTTIIIIIIIIIMTIITITTIITRRGHRDPGGRRLHGLRPRPGPGHGTPRGDQGDSCRQAILRYPVFFCVFFYLGES